MSDFTKIGDYVYFHGWYKNNYANKSDHDIGDIIYALGDVITQHSDGYEDEYDEMHIFFRPYYFDESVVGNEWLIEDSDGNITILKIQTYKGMWKQNTPVDTTGMNQDLSKILDDWEKHDSVPGGSGNNWIFNPQSTQRWKDIVLERDEQCRSFWGDGKIAEMMISNLNNITPSNPETINYKSIRYK